ncbi:unnamed protein product [Musa hybrid cultivar]
MSDEEHHFESKADAGASKTYPQQAGAIRKNGYIVIKGRPCKVPLISVSFGQICPSHVFDLNVLKIYIRLIHLNCLQFALVVEVSTSKTGKHGHAKCHFVAIDVFNAKKLEDIVPSSHNCDVPHVNRTDYQLIDISEDGFVSLLMENGNTKDDLRLPTDETLLAQIYLISPPKRTMGLHGWWIGVLDPMHLSINMICLSNPILKLVSRQYIDTPYIKDGFADGKDLVVTVMSAMGEEQICALKDIGPK